MLFTWKRLFASSFILLIVASGTFVYAKFSSALSAVIVDHEGDSSSILSYDPADGTPNPSLFKKAGDGRFNIVIVGVGGENHPGGKLTDSIQVMSVDTINKKVAMTSIPRDLYVDVPGQGKTKINAAYQLGEQKKTGDGPLAVKQAIGSVLGITVSNFVLIDFSGAKQLVDAVGGIDVDVPKAIYDPYFPDDRTVGYSPFSIKAGMQHMNGETALKYARSRETTSDFDRSARQQIIIQALKKKATSAGTLSNPTKVMNMVNALGSHIKTDMQTGDIKQFISIYQDVPSDKSENFVLDTSEKLGLLTSSSNTAAGYIAYPVLGQGKYEDIAAWFQKNNPDPLLIKEQPTVTVVAGANTTAKQVQTMVDRLNDYGYKATVGSGTQSGTSTVIYDTTKNKKPVSRNYLGSQFSTTVKDGSKLGSGSHFEIIYVAKK
ncbi:MAG: putative LytR family transcriptional protein [Patescibacteria group bacterium]|jgi:LCP family protein required for cell wall assembly|nr:putative LytR family transcriptional protein [Patescibacteria group bacterium]